MTVKSETDRGEGALLSVRGLTKNFASRKLGRAGSVVRAVDGVDLTIEAGECLAIVGESGSGKSTLARTVTRLIEPTDGEITFDGRDLLSLSSKEMRAARAGIQMVFQDPYASLNPRQTVGALVSEPWKVHTGLVPASEHTARVGALLSRVGLPAAYQSLYPSRLSGGERQRVAIARALALEPRLLILDEPVSALDVSIQAQVINVLMRLHRELDLAYMFISHDLALVRLVADRVAVMYHGQLVETGDVEEIYSNAKHPYTLKLLKSSPVSH